MDSCIEDESPAHHSRIGATVKLLPQDVHSDSLSEQRILGAVAAWENERVISLMRKMVEARPEVVTAFRPDRVENSKEEKPKREIEAQGCPSAPAALDVEEVVLEEPGNQDPPTIIQFSSFTYFCEESETHMSIDVKRMGNVSGRAEVRYTTRDGTGKAGHAYVHTEGKLVYEPGERDKTIEIDLINIDGWTGAMTFGVELLPDELCGATLGRHLYKARVTIIDNTSFPTNKYSRPIMEDKIESIPKWSLLMEYWKFNCQNPVVSKGTKKTMLVEQIHNLEFILNLFLNVYLIDYILNLDVDPESFISKERHHELLMLVLAKLVPFALLHFLDYRKLTWKVGGGSRMTLQKSLLRRYLHYTEESRASLDNGDIIMSMARDSVGLAHDGFVCLIALSKNVGQLVMILIFQLTSPAVFGKEPRPWAFLPLTVCPIVLLPFLICRQRRTLHYQAEKERKQNAIIERVSRTVANYRLVADYNQRPEVVSWFEAVVKQFNSAAVAASQVVKNNEYSAPWITMLLVSVYTIVGGMQVVDGLSGLSLGMFLTNLHIFNAIGHAYGSIYKLLLQMQSSFGALERIVRLMNKPIDLQHRLKLGRKRRALTSQLRDEILAGKPDFQGFALDLLPIKLQELNFKYPTSSVLPGLSSGQLEIQQGTFVSLVGPPGEGKSTLLKILGGVILPPEGTCFLPSHLRVLHVGTESMFCVASFLKNLTFGMSENDPDAAPERVKKICSMVGMPGELMAFLDSDRVWPWEEVLSMTSRYMVNLARAFIHNPEVLCIHKPLLPFDDAISKRVLALLRHFVDCKGVAQIESPHLRRPRTCIMTSAKMTSVQAADQVYHISAKAGIKLIPKENVDFRMIG